MKLLLLIPFLGIAMFTGCRVVPSVDPMTMEPSARCTPGNVTGVVIESSK